MTLFCGLLLAAVPSIAHHSVAAEYDFDKPVEFTGTLKQMEWINPHAMLHLEVTNANGSKAVWIFQTTGAAVLRQKRSEEHTSELQSQSNLVCRLLLEKKKKDTEENPARTQRMPNARTTPHYT